MLVVQLENKKTIKDLIYLRVQYMVILYLLLTLLNNSNQHMEQY